MSTSKDVYLVIGGSGFVGRRIVETLVQRGDVVSVLDIVQRYHDVPFFLADVSEEGSVADALKKSGATVIIHTASPLPGLQDELYRKVNVTGSKAIIAAATACGVRKLVYTSSAGVVFDGHDLEGVDEKFPPPKVPVDVYNGTKLEAENLMLAANGKGGLLTVALRPAGIFGPGDRQMMRTMQDVYNRGQSHIQIGNNTNLFDWTYVDNVVQAHILAADRLVNSDGTPNADVAGEVFFVTNGAPVPFWDFMHQIHKLLHAATPGAPPQKAIFRIPKTAGYVLAWFSEMVAWLLGREPTFTRYRVMYTCAKRWHSIEKAQRVLGYKPDVGVEEGVKRMLEWWVAQRATLGG